LPKEKKYPKKIANKKILARKRYKFCQKNIERVGKGLVVSWLGSRYRLRGSSIE